MYRDFLYLDTDRLQSIIAQLEKGVLEQILEGKTKTLEGKASVSLLLPSHAATDRLQSVKRRGTTPAMHYVAY